MFDHLEDVLATFPLVIDKEEYRARWWEGLDEFLCMWSEEMPTELRDRLSAASARHDEEAVLPPLIELRGQIAPKTAKLGQVGRMLNVNAGEAICAVVGATAAGHMTPRQAGALFKSMGFSALGASLPAGQKLRERPMLTSADDPDAAGELAAFAAVAALPERTE